MQLTIGGFSDEVKEASRSLNRLAKYLQLELKFTVFENITVARDGNSYEKQWPTFSRYTQKQFEEIYLQFDVQIEKPSIPFNCMSWILTRFIVQKAVQSATPEASRCKS